MAEWLGVWGGPGWTPAGPHEGHLLRNADAAGLILPSQRLEWHPTPIPGPPPLFLRPPPPLLPTLRPSAHPAIASAVALLNICVMLHVAVKLHLWLS